MSTRITRKQLDSAVEGLNILTGSPLDCYTDSKANVNNYHISGAYGGYCLHQMVNESGGCRDVFNCGHVSARELIQLLWAYCAGFSAAATK